MRHFPRFGSDVDQAQKRIARLLEHVAAIKRRQEARGPDFVPQDPRNAAAADQPNVPSGPSVWDAARAIEEMEAEKEQQREAEGSQASNIQVAQNAQAADATQDDPYTDDDWLRELAFSNTSAWEQFRPQVYYDKSADNVPTVGFGYTPVYHNGSKYVLRSDTDLRNAGVNLSAGDKTRLQLVTDILNKQSTSSLPDIGEYDLTLTKPDARKTFDAVFPVYKGYAMRALNTEVDGRYVDRFSRLRPEQQAALIDMAYMGPRRVMRNSDELRAALDQDWQDRENNVLARPDPSRPTTHWNRMAQVIDTIFGGANEVRSLGNGDIFRYPTAERVYQAQWGDNPTTIARKISMTLEAFLQRYPDYRNRPVRSGERIHFKPTYRPDLRGRAP